ncbi:MAG: hypothetical protein NZ889_00790 [Candidatus Pacearchaeota archaeon]|nr:hypothetical protein [Candidatus Pacearchaeota archaeon]
MKLNFFLIFVLILFFPFCSAQTIQEISQSFSFNFIILFLIIFFGCFVILRDIFHLKGVAVIISLVLALGGSFGVLSKYGPFVPKLDLWVVLLFFGLVIFVIKSLLRPGRDTVLTITFFALPLAWFVFIKEKMAFQVSNKLLNTIDAVLGVMLLVAILMFVLSLVKQKEKPRFFSE